MRVRVDFDACTGHGRCYVLAPEVFAPDDEGYNTARGGVLEVVPGAEAAAHRGVHACPEAALTVEDA